MSDYENLLWTTASSDSSDLDMPTEKMKDKGKKTDSQSETEEKYKLLNDIDYTASDKCESSPKKSKKRKIKEESEDRDRASPERKKIKTEPTSDTEVKRRKKKKEDKKRRAAENCTSDAADHSEEGQAYDESFLNLKVKQETFVKPSPVILNKKHKNQSANYASSEQSDTDTDSIKKKESKKKRKNSNTVHSHSETEQNLKQEFLSAASESENSELQTTKKKKSKKKRKNNNTDHSYSETEQNEQNLKQELLNAAIESENSELQRTEKKKSKKKRKNCNTDHSYSETEQNLKQELFDAASEYENSELQKIKKKKSKQKMKNSNTDHSYSETEQNLKQELLNSPSKSENSELTSTKKKKSKKNAEPNFYPSNEFVNDDDSSSDEVKVWTLVTQKKSQSKKRKESLNVSFANTINKNSTDESQEPTSKGVNGHISAASSNEQPSYRKVSNSVRSISSQHQDANYGSESDNSRKRTTSETKSLLNATAPAVISQRRISERIAFEDDDESQPSIENKTQLEDKNDAHNDHIMELSISARVKNYLFKKNTLKRVTTLLPSDHLISDDDDIWIIKCPHDVDINSMNGVYLSLESKSKIRVNDKSYEGNIEEDINRSIILSSENKQYVLKNIPVKATIRFRKRIPKPHMREDNIMPNNQTNFIPLPETKCRHPLFGINYKPALNLPPAVAQRLRGEGESFAEPGRSKKRKHRESITEPEPDTESEVVPKKKKRKHKHTDRDEEAPSNSKKIKRDPDAAEVWESEQAIEESLFNF